jgi:hypothetical protein
LITAVHFLRIAFQKGRPLGHSPSDAFPTRAFDSGGVTPPLAGER